MPDNISEILLEVGKTLGETAFMCSIALVIAIVAGGALGILLYASSTHLFINSPLLNKVLGATVNVVRSIPFLILLIFLLQMCIRDRFKGAGIAAASVAAAGALGGCAQKASASDDWMPSTWDYEEVYKRQVWTCSRTSRPAKS